MRNAASRWYATMHQEIVTLRQTLKTAKRHGWLDRLPDFSEPYRLSSKISYRAWFCHKNTRNSVKRLEASTRAEEKGCQMGKQSNLQIMSSSWAIPGCWPMTSVIPLQKRPTVITSKAANGIGRSGLRMFYPAASCGGKSVLVRQLRGPHLST